MAWPKGRRTSTPHILGKIIPYRCAHRNQRLDQVASILHVYMSDPCTLVVSPEHSASNTVAEEKVFEQHENPPVLHIYRVLHWISKDYLGKTTNDGNSSLGPPDLCVSEGACSFPFPIFSRPVITPLPIRDIEYQAT